MIVMIYGCILNYRYYASPGEDSLRASLGITLIVGFLLDPPSWVAPEQETARLIVYEDQ